MMISQIIAFLNINFLLNLIVLKEHLDTPYTFRPSICLNQHCYGPDNNFNWDTMGNLKLHRGPKSCPLKLRGRCGGYEDEQLSNCWWHR